MGICIIFIVAIFLVAKFCKKTIKFILFGLIILAALYYTIIEVDKQKAFSYEVPIFAKLEKTQTSENENREVYKGLGYKIIMNKDEYDQLTSINMYLGNTLIAGVEIDNVFPVISIEAKEDTVTANGATFVITNNSANDYYFGEPYSIEYKNKDKWEEIELESPLAWIEIVYMLNANSACSENIDWSMGYGALQKGEYRLVKEFMQIPTTDEEQPSQFVTAYAEFEIK